MTPRRRNGFQTTRATWVRLFGKPLLSLTFAEVVNFDNLATDCFPVIEAK